MIFIALYLVGFFLAFGITKGSFDKDGKAETMTALVSAIFSWYTVGLAISDIIFPEDKKIDINKL